MPPVSASLSARDDETLDRYAATGGMAADRIRRILADLAPSLQSLHQAGRAHGAIAPSTIALDASGRARLLTSPLTLATDAQGAPRRDGYAALEQYTDDPDTPCGPWTDIYALCATACALLTGLAPPSAPARSVRDEYVPLAQRRGRDEQAFCAVLDSGLAMDPYARPQTIDQFARALADAHGLERTSNVEGTPPGPTSQLALYREGKVVKARGATPDTPAHVCLAAQYERAVAAIHARDDGQPGRPPPKQRRASARPQHSPRQHASRRHRPRHRAPRLLILAASAMIAVAFYVWLRPQPTPRAHAVARASNTVSGNVRGDAPKDRPGNASNTPADGASVARADSVSATPAGAAFITTGSVSPTPAGSAFDGAPGTTPAGAPNDATGDASTAVPGSLRGVTSVADAAPSGTRPAPAVGGSPGVSLPKRPPSTLSTPSRPASPPMALRTTSSGSPAADAAAKPRAGVAGKAPVPVPIAIRPWGEILVNGKSHGVSPPLNSLALTPGTYDITIRNNAGPDVHQNLTIAAGKNATISHTFK